ncbi:MAG: hypothetical protein ACK5UE_06510 [Chitinophagales bacterium]|jgi:hypothetical protein|nr:hypothetical protein [Sphingobacteriales bacterium]
MILFNIISILLTLGTSPDCDGFGMCILEQQTEQALETCMKYDNCLEAELGYQDRELLISVSHKKMKDNIYIKHFTTENFRLDKDFTIPNNVAESIGCPQGLTIPAGKYPIYEEGGKIVVRIRF